MLACLLQTSAGEGTVVDHARAVRRAHYVHQKSFWHAYATAQDSVVLRSNPNKTIPNAHPRQLSSLMTVLLLGSSTEAISFGTGPMRVGYKPRGISAGHVLRCYK